MYNHVLYLWYWVVNASVILFLSVLPGSAVDLSSSRLTEFKAALYGGFWLTTIVWIFWDLAIARKKRLVSGPWSYYYFLVINLMGVWLVSQFGGFTGLSVESFSWALLLGVLANGLQRSVFRRVSGGKD